MKVGVTGGAGFIGSHVIQQLQMRGHDPLIFDHLNRFHHPIRVHPVESMLGDIRDATAMTELAAHVDGIIHLAAVLGTQETILNPRPAMETNLTGGLNFLEACNQYDLPGVYIAVGNHWMNNPYSISKTAVERSCDMFNRFRGGRVNVVRAMNAYGPGQQAASPFASGRVRKIMPAFVCRALSGMPIEVYGDGQQVSDMVWVGDVAKALVLALEHADQGKVVPTVEVGPVEHRTVNQVAQVVRAEAVSRGFERVDVKHLPMRPGETPGDSVTADTETLRAIGMDPAELVPLEEGVVETVAWFIKNRGVTWQ